MYSESICGLIVLGLMALAIVARVGSVRLTATARRTAVLEGTAEHGLKHVRPVTVLRGCHKVCLLQF